MGFDRPDDLDHVCTASFLISSSQTPSNIYMAALNVILESSPEAYHVSSPYSRGSSIPTAPALAPASTITTNMIREPNYARCPAA